jgi:hypothetical protein
MVVSEQQQICFPSGSVKPVKPVFHVHNGFSCGWSKVVGKTPVLKNNTQTSSVSTRKSLFKKKIMTKRQTPNAKRQTSRVVEVHLQLVTEVNFYFLETT